MNELLTRLFSKAAVLAAACTALFGSFETRADVKPHAGMLRFPDVSQSHIVFVYANDLWIVPRSGGTASPLASPPGPESFPRFSPDGSSIAFMGNYDGNRDLYTIPLGGGAPTRVTHHPATENLCDWTPDGGGLVFFASGMGGLTRQTQLFTVPASGGLPEQLPVPYGANAAISPDGTWLAYTPHTIDARTWKRYRGGMATDVWLFNLKDKTSKRITDWEGTDSQPMWSPGGDAVYYLSDQGPEHRLNIWKHDLRTATNSQITAFKDFDVKWPAIGPGSPGPGGSPSRGEIVFQLGSDLMLLDLANNQSRRIEVFIPGDRPKIRPQSVDASRNITGWDLSPSAKRAVVTARGDVWTLPVEHGSPRNLTRTADVHERSASWSPDGQWIAYFSDATGEYELYITLSDGKGQPRQLTTGESAPQVFRYNPVWSPDSKHIAFTDKSGSLYLHTIEPALTRLLDTDPYANRSSLSWSHDSRWIAYDKTGDDARQMSSIWIFDVEQGKTTQATSGMFNDSTPCFDRKGDYLYFVSNRSFRPQYGELDTSFIYAGTQVLMAAPLRADVKSPYAPKSDEEDWKKNQKKDSDKEKEKDKPAPSDAPAEGEKPAASDKPEAAPEEKKPEPAKEAAKKTDSKPREKVEIDFDVLDRRAIQLSPRAGNFGGLGVNDKGHLIFARTSARGFDQTSAVKIIDLGDEKKEEKEIVSGTASFVLSADGKKILTVRGRTGTVQDASAGSSSSAKAVVTANMNSVIDPRAEWRQIFNEAWRLQRDFFYVSNLHGVDWDRVRDQYSVMLADAASREDIAYILGEMIAELNVGHAYVTSPGDVESQPSVGVGLLGADYELVKNDQGSAYRFAAIVEGAPWDADARGPLSQPGIDVKTGEFLLAVNGVPVDTSKDPWAAFQGLTGRSITITVGPNPVLDDSARDLIVEPLTSENNLRYRNWIEAKRSYVERMTDGKVGYIYVPNTGVDGQNDLVRQFYGQLGKQALIIDERWNGGGQIPTRFIELLNRPVTNYWARRDGRDWTWPPDAHQGPKCMLINGLAGSGGDMFPWLFRFNNLGKLIGTRTWGGLVGISGNPSLIDGGGITAPTFGFYKKEGGWGIEGHGVDPDIEVIDDPALMHDGGDPQLDAAIGLMLAEIRANPYVPPKRPTPPDRSGMGISPEDK